LLRVDDIAVEAAGINILKGISFSVEEKEIVALIGSNGAGKTTTLTTIMGLHRPVRGRIIFNEETIQGLRPEEIVSKGISIIPEGRRVFAPLTVIENLMIGGIMQNRKRVKSDLQEIMDLFPSLKRRAKQPAGRLSGGEQQMLAIARGLMSHPKLLLMDEPSMGLAPLIIEEIFNILQAINKKGTTIVLVEQNARLALEFADRGYVMVSGRIVKSGSRQTLLEDDFVRKAYLGQHGDEQPGIR
jgi:branched-chain amino acid transport system ATP-binding protein